MAKKYLLNTAVEATFKDGHTEKFDTIEEASEKTGISIQAIKMRANKHGNGKDKTQFRWLDESTIRHYRAKNSKNKGSKLELDVIHKLNELGFNCVSSRAQSKMLDNAKVDIYDLEGNLPTYIQCKATQQTPSYFKIKDDCPLKDKPFTVIWKKQTTDNTNSPGTVAIIDVDFFYKLLSLIKKC